MKKTLFYSMAVVALGCFAVACNQNSDKNGQQQASSTNEIQMVDATSDTLDTRKPIVKNDKDVEVSIDNVPQVAKDLLVKYFPGKEATRVTTDNDDFTIYFKSGEKVEFNKQGEWKEFKCMAGVPAGVIPQQIKSQAGDATITKLERVTTGGYEIELNNGKEIKFNQNFQVVEVDND